MGVVEFIGWFVIVAVGLAAVWGVIHVAIAFILLRAMTGPGKWDVK